MTIVLLYKEEDDIHNRLLYVLQSLRTCGFFLEMAAFSLFESPLNRPSAAFLTAVRI